MKWNSGIKTLIVIVLFLLFENVLVSAQHISDSLPVNGQQKANASFFRERYLLNDAVHYFDNLNDFITYQSETTGSFNTPDQLIFSIAGNSHKWNKYYMDGFRLDSRFFAGSAFFVPDLYSQNLSVDYFNSTVSYKSEDYIPNSVSLNYNVGGLGGISPGTNALINLYHPSASERLYRPIEHRNKMKGAGTIAINYALPVNGKSYQQQLYATFGTRMLTDFDETGISEFYPENFYKMQLSGQLPINSGRLFDKTSYLLNISGRDNLYNELYYSKAESAAHQALGFSVYGSKKHENSQLTTGLTFAYNQLKHSDLNFSRNIVDQDGEAFEPWYPDGVGLELSHALNYERKFSENLKLYFDGYNSLLQFNPENQQFSNPVFARNVNLSYRSLYVYDWTAQSFAAGLLENTLGLSFEKNLSSKLNFAAQADVTFDAMIIENKSRINPNWQAKASLQFRPAAWFYAEMNLARNRISYNADDVRYISDDYMNAEIYYWQDHNQDSKIQTGEKSDLFSTSGGKYRSVASGLKQPSYFVFDIPFHFLLGRHTISFLQSYRKYNHNLTTGFDKAASDYGYFVNQGDKDIYFMNNGVKNYVLDYYPDAYMKTAQGSVFLTNSPYYISSVVKYSYTTEKFLLSLSWTSYLMAGISTLGNGPLHNNLGVYSESTANPNINYKLLGRLDQERAYVARIHAAYKVSKHLNFSVTAKFKDGQPFANFETLTVTDAAGNNQMAIWAKRTKGINPFTGDFGSREDSFFNVDLRALYSGKVAGEDYELSLLMYNLYDFGTELTEYTFQPDDTGKRYPLSMNIPRGLILGAKIYF
jgi:hypothetical protein